MYAGHTAGHLHVTCGGPEAVVPTTNRGPWKAKGKLAETPKATDLWLIYVDLWLIKWLLR